MAGVDTLDAFSGEFMTHDVAQAASRAGNDVLDADYVSLPRVSPCVTRNPTWGRQACGSPAVPPGGLEILKRGASSSASLPQSESRALWGVVVAGAAAAVFWVSGGHALLRHLPSAPTKPASALRISDVASRVDASRGRAVLLIDGQAVNEGSVHESVPAVEIAVTGNDGQVTRYRLGTSGHPLRTGETFGFSGRLNAPTSGVRIVSVSFGK